MSCGVQKIIPLRCKSGLRLNLREADQARSVMLGVVYCQHFTRYCLGRGTHSRCETRRRAVLRQSTHHQRSQVEGTVRLGRQLRRLSGKLRNHRVTRTTTGPRLPCMHGRAEIELWHRWTVKPSVFLSCHLVITFELGRCSRCQLRQA